jgi:CheY-like chemotaxis protein
MANLKDKDSIDLIFHTLQEHEERFKAIDKRLDEIKKIIAYYSPRIKKLESEINLERPQSDLSGSILVVDDDPNIVKTFKMILEGKGYSVDTANNAIDAIRKASKVHYDLVIIDMSLPDTLGDILAERLMAVNNKLRVIMVTGYSEYKGRAEKNLDRIDVLMKPINPEELIVVTQKTLNKK